MCLIGDSDPMLAIASRSSYTRNGDELGWRPRKVLEAVNTGRSRGDGDTGECSWSGGGLDANPDGVTGLLGVSSSLQRVGEPCLGCTGGHLTRMRAS